MAIIAAVEDGKLVDSSSTTTSSKTENSNDLGYDQFLQLLCAEMQYQDPLEPTSNTEYVAQLATFSQMEATLAMQNTIESSNANALVGQYVIIKTTSSTGNTTATAGFVDYIQKENGEQKVSVNGTLYSLSDVYQVADPEYIEATTLADAFVDAVAAVPGASVITLADKSDVKNLKTYYDSLNSYQKSYIDNDTLTKYNELIKKMEELAGESWYEDATEVPGDGTDVDKPEDGTDGDGTEDTQIG